MASMTDGTLQYMHSSLPILKTMERNVHLKLMPLLQNSLSQRTSNPSPFQSAPDQPTNTPKLGKPTPAPYLSQTETVTPAHIQGDNTIKRTVKHPTFPINHRRNPIADPHKFKRSQQFEQFIQPWNVPKHPQTQIKQ